LIAWLFWLSLIVLVYAGGAWLIATFWEDSAVRLVRAFDCERNEVSPPDHFCDGGDC
jgi:hypothetical protein